MFFFYLVLSLLLLYIFFKYYEHRNIFKPTKLIVCTPEDHGMEFEELSFPARDKVILRGWFINGEKEEVVLICHGQSGNISTRMDTIKVFNELDYKVLIFDYRGYGGSEGIPTEDGLYLDALGAYDIVHEKGFSNDRIVVFGHSLGGAVAINLASRVGIRGLIVDSSFKSVGELSKDILGFNMPELLLSNSFNSIEIINRVNVPKLIIHSIHDDFIPFYHGKDIYREAIPPKSFLEIRGKHNSSFLDSEDVYRKGIKRFLENI